MLVSQLKESRSTWSELEQKRIYQIININNDY